MCTEELWIWKWQQGGHGSCIAKDRDEAVLKGNRISSLLTIDESTIHIGTHEEVQRLHRQDYSWMYGY